MGGVLTLTKREAQIVRLMCIGLTDEAIGTKLGIAHDTARGHRTNLFRKLQVTNRAAAVTVWLTEQSRETQTELAALAIYAPGADDHKWN